LALASDSANKNKALSVCFLSMLIKILFLFQSSLSVDIWPTVFHLTQYKAGSQWIYHILKRCAPERVVTPKLEVAHGIKDPILAGHIYPTVYLTKEKFDQIKNPRTQLSL
jgi:hypothetical protein